ncbi:hypothetical protein VKT23_018374 [Stygiomarasmius scandens]|uniref:FAD/NAD(P)-binding domain-containing protein n=1 Tax=Marasmiellus scandens TaxID=2682957 RepID=A0ABR1IPH8_9AGAR
MRLTLRLTSVLAAAVFSLTATRTHAQQAQQPFILNNEFPTQGDAFYEFKWPVKKVAIIGAGAGGLISYRTLSQAGYEVLLYERDHHPGGNWHYTEETPPDAPIPNLDPAIADFVPSLPPKGITLPFEEVYDLEDVGREKRAFRAPKPIWRGLRSNAPKVIQQIRELPWPEDLSWDISAIQLQGYLRAFASYHGINANDENPNVFYNTRVELVEKRYDTNTGEHRGWRLTLKEFKQIGSKSVKARWWTEDVDAVVIASGRYNAPNVPGIPGLDEWNAKFPGSVTHSRVYKTPEEYENKTVLIIGAATSGAEISGIINPYAKKVYLSNRGHHDPHYQYPWDIFLTYVPDNVTFVPEIKAFHPANSAKESIIEFVNGTKLTGIDRVISSTGYRYSFPFFPQYHDTSLGDNETASEGPQPLVTDGSHIRSLHLDLVYIEEPTIAFINMNLGIQSFTYSEYQAAALASVWKGQAKIPTQERMWELFEKRLEEFGGAFDKHWLYLGTDGTQGV